MASRPLVVGRTRPFELWDAKTGSQVGPAMRHDESVVGALLMPGGHILSWSADKTLRLWDAKTGSPGRTRDAARRQRRRRTPNARRPRPSSWSADGTLPLDFWDAKTGSQVGPAMRHDDRVVGALLMPDGRILSWSADETLQLWGRRDGQPGRTRHAARRKRRRRTPNAGRPHPLVVSRQDPPNSGTPKTGSQVGPAMRHAGGALINPGVHGALLMPSGHILSWSSDNTLRLWDAKTGSQVGPPMQHDPGRPITGGVHGALVTPDGRILSWTGDSTLYLWDPETNNQIGPTMRAEPSTFGIFKALLIPDGRIVALSGNSLRLWNINWPKGSLFEMACALLPDLGFGEIAKLYTVLITDPVCEHPTNIPLPDWTGSIELTPNISDLP